jgi:hypothetical protein
VRSLLASAPPDTASLQQFRQAHVLAQIEAVATKLRMLQGACSVVLIEGANGRSFIVFHVDDGIE